MEAALLCLALNIYYEARAEPLEGQYAIASVTLNRVADPSYPNRVCKVVYQSKQFSWTAKQSELRKPFGVAWKRARTIAREMLHADVSDVDTTQGATHFHNTKVRPKWSKRLWRVKRIGQHIFYKSTL